MEARHRDGYESKPGAVARRRQATRRPGMDARPSVAADGAAAVAEWDERRDGTTTARPGMDLAEACTRRGTLA